MRLTATRVVYVCVSICILAAMYITVFNGAPDLDSNVYFPEMYDRKSLDLELPDDMNRDDMNRDDRAVNSFTAVNQSVNSNDFVRYNIVRDRVEGNFNVRAKTPSLPPKVTKVLIVAYFRSGSSVTAALLNQGSSFYMFEPLNDLYEHAMPFRHYVPYYRPNAYVLISHKEFSNLHKHDRNIWYHTLREDDRENMRPIARHIIDAILDCKIDHRSWIQATGLSRYISPIPQFNECIKNFHPWICWPMVGKMCRDKRTKIRLVKTIRLSMRDVRYFLQKHPELKIIHLIRDPRGVLCSFFCLSQEYDWSNHCNTVRSDLVERGKLEREFPGRIMEVVYENVAHYPYKMAAQLYEFIQQPFPDTLNDWITEHMFSSKLDGRFNVRRSNSTDVPYRFNNLRQNSTRIPYKWVHLMHENHIRYANEYCDDIIKHGKFTPVKTKDDLVNIVNSNKIPHRPFK